MSSKGTAKVRLDALKRWRDSGISGSRQRKLTEYQLKRIADSGAVDTDGVMSAASGDRALVQTFAPQIVGVLQSCAEEDLAKAPSPGSGSGPKSSPESAVPLASDFAEARVEGLDSIGQPETLPRVDSDAVGDGIVLSWAPAEAASRHVVYRVVSADHPNPAPPGYGDLVGICHESRLNDEAPFSRAVRYYSVWANTGASRQDALSSQPTLVAYGGVVSPVTNWSIVERAGDVIGEWSVPAGAHSVVVHRHAQNEPISPANRLANPSGSDDANLRGFVDRGMPLQPYVYTVYVMAEVNSARTASAQVSQQITIPAIPEQVTDLTVEERTNEADEGVFDVSWTSPQHGFVDVYLTQEQPDPGLAHEPREADALSTSVLEPDTRILYPQVMHGERMLISGVRWDRGWFRAYVTPVTRSGDRVQVGSSIAFNRMNEVQDAVLRERVDSQVVVFDWPGGAYQVAAYLTLPGARWEGPGNAVPHRQISREDYDHLGGMTMELEGRPLDVHLVPQTWEKGSLASGSATTLHYPGLARIAYEYFQETVTKGVFKKRRVPTGPKVARAHSDSDLPGGVRFSLVFNRDRLPLSARDGQALATQTTALVKNERKAILPLSPPGATGYVRLFAEPRDSGTPIALIDPDVSQLRV